MTPEQAKAVLEAVLTAGGATASAAIIATLIQILKRTPGLGSWLDQGKETLVALLGSAALVAYAGVATIPVWDAVTGFGLFLAWLGLAAIATTAHNVAPQELRDGLSGKG